MNILKKNGILFFFLTLILVHFIGCQQPTSNNETTVAASTGDAKWTLINSSSSTVDPKFNGSWVNYSAGYPCGFRKDGQGVVHLKGIATSGTGLTAIFYLPVGYRPATYQTIGNTTVYINVGTNGFVTGNTSTVYFDGISFLAEL